MKCSDDRWQLMNLKTFLENIRKNKPEGDRSYGHRVYEYTDAQIFDKMRKFHDELSDEEEKKEEFKYINDCIKIIMDGKVSDPVVGAQKIVDLAKYPKIKQEIEDKGKAIAKDIASTLQIQERRIIVNAVKQRIMKYTDISANEEKEDEEANREAVRIVIKNSNGTNILLYAPKSNASVLSGLVDKALLVFNVYYIEDKKKATDEVVRIRESIKNGFDTFIQEDFRSHPRVCGCESGEHLCQIIQGKNGLAAARKLAQNATYICRKCGMVSSDLDKLYQGVDLKLEI